VILFVPIFLFLAELFWQIYVNYPPTSEQLNFGVTNYILLWSLRIISFIFIIGTSFFLSKKLRTRIKSYYFILILICPCISLIWMSYPLDALKLFIISGIFYFLTRKNHNYYFAVIITTIAILSLNLGFFNQNPNILKIVSLKQPQSEVNFRFLIEDNLNPNISVPKTLKRLVYNKIFFALRDSVNESLTFFDFETLFFQEIHPLGQKAFVIFFWPEIVIFCLSLWLVMTKKISSKKEFLSILLISFIYFITTNVSTERRLIFSLFPLSIIMAECINQFLKSRSKKTKYGIIFLILLTSYGWLTNYYDRFVRPNFWLDNRPIAYNFFLSYLKTQTLNYSQIIVSENLSESKKYCLFYLKDCSLLKTDNFDLSKNRPNRGVLYIGFTGNFLGQNSENSFPQDANEEIKKRELEILKKTHILDNIANKYGQELFIVQTKDKQ